VFVDKDIVWIIADFPQWGPGTTFFNNAIIIFDCMWTISASRIGSFKYQ
jgi:hypothetical protein